MCASSTLARFVAFLSLLALCAQLDAANCSPIPLPNPDTVFASGFEPEIVEPDPSGGFGGDPLEGDHTGSFTLDGTTKTFYYRVPPGYSNASAAPLLVVLHGAAGSADIQASQTRALWADYAD